MGKWTMALNTAKKPVTGATLKKLVAAGWRNLLLIHLQQSARCKYSTLLLVAIQHCQQRKIEKMYHHHYKRRPTCDEHTNEHLHASHDTRRESNSLSLVL